MKVQINFKYVSHEVKTSNKGNEYTTICVLQGTDLEKLYYPKKINVDIETLKDCKGVLEIKNDKFGTHLTLVEFEVIK